MYVLSSVFIQLETQVFSRFMLADDAGIRGRRSATFLMRERLRTISFPLVIIVIVIVIVIIGTDHQLLNHEVRGD